MSGYDPAKDDALKPLEGLVSKDLLLFMAMEYLADENDQQAFFRHFVPLISKTKRDKDEDVLEVLKMENGGMVVWGSDSNILTTTGYTPEVPKFKAMMATSVRRMVARMFVSLHLLEIQMIGHKRFQNEDEEYFPTPIPSEQLDLDFLLQGSSKNVDWLEEWKASVRKKDDDPSTFDTSMADTLKKKYVLRHSDAFKRRLRTGRRLRTS